MYGVYRHASDSEAEDSSNHSTSSFYNICSLKKKTVPLHKRRRNLENRTSPYEPLRLIYTSPGNSSSSNVINGPQSKEEKESYVGNSLGNIQEVPENQIKEDNSNPAKSVDDSLEDLLPSETSKYDTSCSSSKSQMEISLLHGEENKNMEVSPLLINDIRNIHVLGNIQNLPEMRLDLKKTPENPNSNKDIIAIPEKVNIYKENYINNSAYHKLTPENPNSNKDIITIPEKVNIDKENYINNSAYHKLTPENPNSNKDIITIPEKVNIYKENYINNSAYHKLTPENPNSNKDIITIPEKVNIDKENYINNSAYHNKLTPVPRPHNGLSKPSSTALQLVTPAMLNQREIKYNSRNTREENFPVKMLKFQTPNRISENAKSDCVMMPPPVPQIKVTPEQKQIYVINGKNYEIQSILGRGGSSKVYQVLDPETSCQLAMKEVDLSFGEKSVIEGYLQEIDLLKKMQDSESVIKMCDYEYIKAKEKLYVIMEKGETDLSKLIKNITKTKPMPIITVVYYWVEMLRAVKDIHAKNIIHLDLKPSNFLLVCGRLKLIDFGIASSVQDDMTSIYKDVQNGTFNYISPEALEKTYNSDKNGCIRLSYKSDIWSLGCILYSLLYGKTPFQHIPHIAKYAAITNKNHCIEYPSTRKDCPPVLLHAVQQCLMHDPKKRPTATSLLELPYLNQLPPESCLQG
ncbi:hypothetical protein L9F63_000342 [Diploptera punctata]|uniref:Protein kinase domain-containing protein n=1 Tax=Diploptera punctata TaxID=6984 RepID=A0AAD8ALW4_DIPPU|nr:hypothetical protein L9F63_000342 [Diploptera punctata]